MSLLEELNISDKDNVYGPKKPTHSKTIGTYCMHEHYSVTYDQTETSFQMILFKCIYKLCYLKVMRFSNSSIIFEVIA